MAITVWRGRIQVAYVTIVCCRCPADLRATHGGDRAGQPPDAGSSPVEDVLVCALAGTVRHRGQCHAEPSGRVGALGWMPYSWSVHNKRGDQERLTPLARSRQVGVDATLRAGVDECGHAALSNVRAAWRLHHRLVSCAKPAYVISCVDRVPSAAIERYRKPYDWLTTLATKDRVDADATQLTQRPRGRCRIGASGRAGLEGFAAVAGRWPCWPLARAKVAVVRSIGSVMAKHAWQMLLRTTVRAPACGALSRTAYAGAQLAEHARPQVTSPNTLSVPGRWRIRRAATWSHRCPARP